jgi:MGT family glycosyltransferase
LNIWLALSGDKIGDALLPGCIRVNNCEMRRSGRFLIVVWAAGGNVLPAAGLSRVLSSRGHEVEVLGSPALQERFEQTGCTFRSFERARQPGPVEEEVFDDNLLGWTRFISGPRLADDVSAELDRQRPDVVVADGFLSAALSAAEKAGVPTAALAHVLYQPSVEGPSAMQWDPTRPMVEATRRHLGLSPLDPTSPLVSALWNRSSLVLACVPESFDYPLANPPTNVRYVGPIFEDALGGRREPRRPLVLVSFSTTNMRQGQALQRVLDALEHLDVDVLCTLGGVPISGLRSPENTTIRDWVPHMEVLSRTSAVVTHAGLSTVMSALANGVPLVCMPMGRDQPMNADRVAASGTGYQIPSDSSVDVIRRAAACVLEESSFHSRARLMAETIAGYGNGSKAACELEALL